MVSVTAGGGIEGYIGEDEGRERYFLQAHFLRTANPSFLTAKGEKQRV